ncbi:MAG: mandelate racemase/muconate lactonizing enzyme family protein [Chloroflexi bacterium]|nr:mandelate racemase/muconate lactonizing enzyme family protein [Chloroflexota bacterium]
MRIVDVRLHPIRVARQYRTVAGHGAKAGPATAAEPATISHFYAVELETDDGRVGFGECSDINPRTTLPDGRPLRAGAARDLLLPLLRGHDPHDTARLEAIFKRAGVRGKLVAAADMACLDLVARAAGQPLYNLLGGRYWRDLPVCWVAYVRHPRDMEPEIAEKVAQGFRNFKLKVGGDIDLDVARVRMVRELAGEAGHIKLDANGAWSVDEAIANLRKLEPYRPAAIETPIPNDDVEGMRRVKANTGIPFMEHGWPAARVLEYLKQGIVDVFKLYAPAYGGLRQAQQVMGMIAAAGKNAYVGSDVEMGVGTLAFGHLAAASPECNIAAWPCDLRGPALLTGDVLDEPVRYDNGKLMIDGRPGLGVTLVPAQLQRLKGDLDE